MLFFMLNLGNCLSNMNSFLLLRFFFDCVLLRFRLSLLSLRSGISLILNLMIILGFLFDWVDYAVLDRVAVIWLLLQVIVVVIVVDLLSDS